jgi:hypothetical protein
VYLPYLLECIALQDWMARKLAIDAIYSLAAIVKDTLIIFKLEILEVLNHSRFDKVKHVREATLEAITLIKEIPDPEQTED